MLSYKNFEVTPGLPLDLVFEVLDETFLKVDMTGYSFKMEVLDSDMNLKYVANSGFASTPGILTKTIPDSDTVSIGPGLFQYRVVMKDTSNKSTLVGKGFLNFEEPSYIEAANPGANLTVLPDGSIYIGAPTLLQYDTWYSISSYYRLVVSDVGILSLDLKNNVGVVFIGTERYTNYTVDDTAWIPDLGQNTSFRLIQLSGTNQVRYLP